MSTPNEPPLLPCAAPDGPLHCDGLPAQHPHSPAPQHRSLFTLNRSDVTTNAESSEHKSDYGPAPSIVVTVKTPDRAPPSGGTISGPATRHRCRARGRSLRTNVLLRAAEFPGESDGDDDDDKDNDNELLGDDDNDDGNDDDEEDEGKDCSSGSLSSPGDMPAQLYPIPSGRERSTSIVMVIPGGNVGVSVGPTASPVETVYWGWVVLLSTWIVVVLGVGSVTGVWEWAWGSDDTVPSVPQQLVPRRKWLMVGSADTLSDPDMWTQSFSKESQFPIPGYYPAICILTCIMAWVWVTVAWVGMKYFKHAKIQG